MNVYNRWWRQDGAFRLSFNLTWAILLANDNLRHYPGRMAKLNADRAETWVTPEEMLSLQIKPLFRNWDYRGYDTIAGVFGCRKMDSPAATHFFNILA